MKSNHTRKGGGRKCAPNLDMFQERFEEALEMATYEPNDSCKRKKRKKRKAESHAKKGLQYKIKLKVWARPRKIGFRGRIHEDESSNDFSWTDSAAGQLYKNFLHQTMEDAKELAAMQSPRILEVARWLSREDGDIPFSLEDVCAHYVDDEIVGLDPDIIRAEMGRMIRKAYPEGYVQDAKKRLKEKIQSAEAGNAKAIEWIRSDNGEQGTFRASCEAFGFDYITARAQIHLPHEELVYVDEFSTNQASA